MPATVIAVSAWLTFSYAAVGLQQFMQTYDSFQCLQTHTHACAPVFLAPFSYFA